MKYVLDPMVLALDEHVSEREFKLYVNRLILWGQWVERYPEDVFLLSNTCELLSMESFFPVYDVFSKLVQKYKVNYVQAADLNKMINKLVGNASKIDNSVVEQVERECDITLVKCDVKRGEECPERMWRAFERVLRCVYCQCKAGVEKSERFVLFGRNLTGQVTVDVTFDTIEEGKDDFVSHREQTKLMCCSSLKEFFCQREMPVRILQQHRGKEDVSLAIRVAVYQKGNLQRVMDAFTDYHFYIQDSFYKDFSAAKYDCQPAFLSSFTNAVGNCLTGTQVRDREDFRTGRGGNNGQLKKNGYAAWRWYVTQSVKMQYWQRERDYRLANIKEHDIYECVWEEKSSVR